MHSIRCQSIQTIKSFSNLNGKSAYTFRGMQNGYSEVMRVLTKLLKPPFSILKSNGYLSAVFFDDSYLQGHTFSTCEDNVNATVNLLQFLGFTIHP